MTKIVVGILVFALVITSALIAYNYLSESVAPQSDIDIAEKREDTQSGDSKEKAPDFSAVDMDGNTVRLSDMTGKPVVLNFWASWCPPCKDEMPVFEKVFRELGGDIHFMMVDLTDGQRETKDKGAQYVSEMGYTFPVYFDEGQEGAYAYAVQSIPTTLFIDREGCIVSRVQGAINETTLKRRIDMIK